VNIKCEFPQIVYACLLPFEDREAYCYDIKSRDPIVDLLGGVTESTLNNHRSTLKIDLLLISNTTGVTSGARTA